MARRVRWTQTAADDLEEIAAYIAEDAPTAARRFVTIAHGARDLEALWERRQQPGDAS